MDFEAGLRQQPSEECPNVRVVLDDDGGTTLIHSDLQLPPTYPANLRVVYPAWPRGVKPALW
ncbi:hypothetical protein GCM10028820_06120 [Tessaracoccus terricola]